jgi:hypothetical protein
MRNECSKYELDFPAMSSAAVPSNELYSNNNVDLQPRKTVNGRFKHSFCIYTCLQSQFLLIIVWRSCDEALLFTILLFLRFFLFGVLDYAIFFKYKKLLYIKCKFR